MWNNRKRSIQISTVLRPAVILMRSIREKFPTSEITEGGSSPRENFRGSWIVSLLSSKERVVHPSEPMGGFTTSLHELLIQSARRLAYVSGFRDERVLSPFRRAYTRIPLCTGVKMPEFGQCEFSIGFLPEIKSYKYTRTSPRRELNEALLNVLEWSDIPTRPDSQYYVADGYFEVTESVRWQKIRRYRLPRIEQRQDDLVFGAASRMHSMDADLVDTLLTDGGATSPKKLARTIGVHLDTVYASIHRLSPLVEHTYGDVQLASKYIVQTESDRVHRFGQREHQQGTRGSTRCTVPS